MPRKKERIRRKVVVGHDSAGNPVIKWAIGYTIKEVEAQKQALIRDFVSGATSDQTDIVYRCFVQQWYCKFRRVSTTCTHFWRHRHGESAPLSRQ